MVTVTGTSGQDFIHLAGDGLVAPPGYTDITGVVDSGTTINAGDGDDIVYGGAARDVITGGSGADALYGGGGYDQFVFNAAEELVAGEIVDGGSGGGGLLLSISEGEVDLTVITINNISSILIGHAASPGVTLILSALQMLGLTDGLFGTTTDRVVITDAIQLNSSMPLQNISSVQLSAGHDLFHLLDPSFRFGTLNFTIMAGDGDDDVALKVREKNQPNTLFGEGGDDKLSITDGLAYLDGGKGSDTLLGGKRGDVLIGGRGHDRLDGGGGSDSLTGGTGSDAFVLTKAKDSAPGANKHDIVTDFSQADGDLIDLSRIDADTTLAGNQAFTLGGSAFTSLAGEVIQFNDGFGHTLVQGDVNGDGIADFELLLGGEPLLTVSDFVF